MFQRSKFKPTYLIIAMSCLSLSTGAMAAGLDRSGQDIKGFFNEGTYAEIDYVYIDTEISGHDHDGPGGIVEDGGEFVKGNSTGNTTPDPYTFMRYGVKTDINDNISVGLFYDEPWGAEARYEGDSNFVSRSGQTVILPKDKTTNIPQPLEEIDPRVNDENYDPRTKVDLHTQSWTGLVGIKSGGLQVYGGPVLQKARTNLQLRGTAYGPLTGYEAVVNNDTAVGWAAGLAYSIPEIALNAALTYRSEIDHESRVAETMPALGNALVKSAVSGSEYSGDVLKDSIDIYAFEKGVITTPESVNLNFQTGLSEQHQLLGIMDVRWVPWSDFSITPPLYNAYSKIKTEDNVGLPLIDYKKDQWKVDVGLAKRFSPAVAGSVLVGWDSGAGNPTSSLGTVEGYYSVGGGVKVNVTPEWAISAGGKYLMFGDAKGELPSRNQVTEFKDNDGYIAGLKLSYEGK